MRLSLTISILLLSLIAFAQNPPTSVDNALEILQNGKFDEAFTMLKRSATTNNLIAQYYTAKCLENGIGVEKNPKEAFLMYRKSAERGLPQAMYDLSRCYSMGIGVEQNDEKAAQWLSRFNSKTGYKELTDITALYQSSVNAGLPKGNVQESSPAITTVTSSPKPTSLRQEAAAIQNPAPNKTISTEPLLISDVDIDIPANRKVNDEVFALIIANENYQEVAKVENALNDGIVFSKYCQKTLGLPESNIHLIKDATLNNIKREVNLIQQIAQAYNGGASFIVYYAGHGFPDEKNQSSYLLPIDGYTSDVTTCYALDDLYRILGELPAKKTIVLIDACFSGSTRGNGMLASARGIAMKPKSNAPTGNTIVISSSQGDETSYPYQDQKHGLFTYFLLKKIKESHGNVALGELVEYIKDNVAKKSIVVNGKSQTPNAIPSGTIQDNWHDWKLN